MIDGFWNQGSNQLVLRQAKVLDHMYIASSLVGGICDPKIEKCSVGIKYLWRNRPTLFESRRPHKEIYLSFFFSSLYAFGKLLLLSLFFFFLLLPLTLNRSLHDVNPNRPFHSLWSNKKRQSVNSM